jgi:L-lactate dehydrogenase
MDVGSNRISIIGAGAVGSSIAFAAMLRGLANRIVLQDKQAHKAQAEAKDLAQGRMFAAPVEVVSGDLDACAGSRVIVVTAGAKQKPGESRLELAGRNAAIFRELIPALDAVALDALLLIVSNPVDVLTHLAHQLTNRPAGRVFGSGTVLDTSRFRHLIAGHINVAVANVHAYIVGEHGDSEVPVWSTAHVGNVPLRDWRSADGKRMTDADRETIAEQVRGAAGEIIAAKGATNWAVALAVVRILVALLRDENAILTVSRPLDDYQGIRDVSLAVPSIVSAKGVEAALPLDYDDHERAALIASADVVRRATASV